MASSPRSCCDACDLPQKLPNPVNRISLPCGRRSRCPQGTDHGLPGAHPHRRVAAPRDHPGRHPHPRPGPRGRPVPGGDRRPPVHGPLAARAPRRPRDVQRPVATSGANCGRRCWAPTGVRCSAMRPPRNCTGSPSARDRTYTCRCRQAGGWWRRPAWWSTGRPTRNAAGTRRFARHAPASRRPCSISCTPVATVDRAIAWLARAVGARLTTPARLRAAVEDRYRLRWYRHVLAALDDAAAGCHSVLEMRYLRPSNAPTGSHRASASDDAERPGTTTCATPASDCASSSTAGSRTRTISDSAITGATTPRRSSARGCSGTATPT